MTVHIEDWLIVGSIAALFALMRRAYLGACRLPERVYRAPCVLAAALRRPAFAGAAVGALVPLLWLSRLGWGHEGGLDDPWPIQLVGGLALGLLAWTNSTYDRNCYLGCGHVIDRAVVLVCAVGAILQPALAPGAVLVAILVWRQIAHPRVIAESVTDKLLSVDVAIAFAAFTALRIIHPAQAQHFLIVAAGLVAIHYVYPAIAKVRLGPRPWTWVLGNRLSDLTVNAWAMGHLGFLRPGAIARLARRLRPLDVPLQVATLALEVGALAILAGRGHATFLLVSLAAMHLAIFAAGGLLFWKWAAIDLALAVALLGGTPATLAPALGLEPVLMTVAIVGAGPLICGPAMLGWYDSCLADAFRCEVVGEDGRVYGVAPNFWAPYDMAFAQGRLQVLLDRPTLVATFGVVRPQARGPGAWRLTRLIERTAGDPRRLARLRARYGVNRFDASAAARFDEFVRRFLGDVAAQGRPRRVLAAVPFPKHFWMWTARPVFRAQVRPVLLRVRYREVFHDRAGVRVVSEGVVRQVALRAGVEPIVEPKPVGTGVIAPAA